MISKTRHSRQVAINELPVALTDPLALMSLCSGPNSLLFGKKSIERDSFRVGVISQGVREGGQQGRKQRVISLQDVSALRNRTMVGTGTLLGSSPLRQRGRGTLDRGTKHLGRGRNAENQRGKAGMKICMYKTVKK